MRAALSVVVGVVSFLFVTGVTSNARAERELIVPFHDGGHLVLDQLSGLRISSASGVSYAGPVGVAFRSTDVAGAETKTTTLWLAPSFDVFVTDHLSVGGLVEVSHSWGTTTVDGQRLELPGTTSMTFLPRLGFFVPFGDRFGLWPRAGVGWASAESASFVASGGAPAHSTFRSMILDVDVSLVYRFNETFFLRVGPEIGATLGGRRVDESGGTSTGSSASVVQIGGVMGFGMNVEL